jgi:hypothetical protein
MGVGKAEVKKTEFFIVLPISAFANIKLRASFRFRSKKPRASKRRRFFVHVGALSANGRAEAAAPKKTTTATFFTANRYIRYIASNP